MSLVSACSSVFTGPPCPMDTSPDRETSQLLPETRHAQTSFWTSSAIDLKAGEMYGLGAFFFYSLIFRFCLGLLPCSGSTAFPGPLGDGPLPELDSPREIMVLRTSVIWVIPGPHSSCLSSAMSGELLHLSFFSKIYLFERERASQCMNASGGGAEGEGGRLSSDSSPGVSPTQDWIPQH